MKIDVEYKNQILQKLIGLRIGETSLDKSSEGYAKFIAAVKTIIDWGQDRDNGFIIEFNHDYSRMRKKSIVH